MQPRWLRAPTIAQFSGFQRTQKAPWERPETYPDQANHDLTSDNANEGTRVRLHPHDMPLTRGK